MREPREEGKEEILETEAPVVKRKAGRPPKAKVEKEVFSDIDQAEYKQEIPNPYSCKIEFRKWNNESDELADQKFDSKGNPYKESRLQLLQRSMFFGNFSNGKYKIIMVYKGRGGIPHHARFDILKPKKDKLKMAFFKAKGIIF
jgi:hypothetical protein